MTGDRDGDLTRDAFLGGRVRLWQPKGGFRSGIDAVLLAAAVPAVAGQTVLDLGCGAGAVGACLAARVPGVRITGVEVQPVYAALARRNGLAEVIAADIGALPADLRGRDFDHVAMNPPYFDRAASTAAADAGRDIARGGGRSLADWLSAGARRLAPRGTLTVIQRAAALPAIFAALPPTLGAIVLQPLSPRSGRDATLILVQARKGGRAAPRLRAPLILHAGDRHRRDGDDYAPAVSAILRDAAALLLTD